MNTTARAFLILTWILIVFVWSATSAMSAPAPLPAREKPHQIVGSWALDFGGTRWDVKLAGDGTCRVSTPNCVYVGTWEVDGGLLVIYERPEGSSAKWQRLTARFDGTTTAQQAWPESSYAGVRVSLSRGGR